MAQIKKAQILKLKSIMCQAFTHVCYIPNGIFDNIGSLFLLPRLRRYATELKIPSAVGTQPW
jgi:hypothetical protein